MQSGEFEWDSRQQGVILAAFFYGYITTQIPGGVLAQRFGSKLLLLFGISWTALLTLLTPVLTRWGDFAGIVATRVLEGVGEVGEVFVFIMWEGGCVTNRVFVFFSQIPAM